MARDFAKRFYRSRAWEEARELCMRLNHGFCARCLAKGRYVTAEIVHHKVHLSAENISNPVVSLAQENLEPLCRKCHAIEHPEIYGDVEDREERMGFDEFGNTVNLEG